MFPIRNLEETNTKENSNSIGTSFKFDFETGQIVIVDGKLTEIDTLANIEQWIETVLRTEADRYKVYTEEETGIFGISIYKHIGQKIQKNGFLLSELKREIEEQLISHEFIESIKDFSTEFKRHTLIISFTVVLSDSSTINITKGVEF